MTGISKRASAPRRATGKATVGNAVTLRRADYEAMLARIEDLEDALELRAAEARGAGPDAWPAELAKQRVAGEHPLRLWRRHRGLTLAALASKARVPVSYVSEIENRRKPGSVAALAKLARALGTALDDLV